MSITSFNTMADVLASEGIINYDAVAYVNGTKPRYIGKPYTYANSGCAYQVTDDAGIYSNPFRNKLQLSSPLGCDTYMNSKIVKKAQKSCQNDKYSKSLKEIGAVGLIASTAIFAVKKVKKSITNGISSIGSKISNIGSKAKKAAKTTPAAGNVAAKTGPVANIASKIKGKISGIKIPKKFKAGAIAALTLFGLYKVATNEKANSNMYGSVNSVPKF